MGARRIRREQKREDMAESRYRNGILKTKERARRDQRLLEALKTGKAPYPRILMNWLSTQLDRPASAITDSDIKDFLKK